MFCESWNPLLISTATEGEKGEVSIFYYKRFVNDYKLSYWHSDFMWAWIFRWLFTFLKQGKSEVQDSRKRLTSGRCVTNHPANTAGSPAPRAETVQGSCKPYQNQTYQKKELGSQQGVGIRAAKSLGPAAFK